MIPLHLTHNEAGIAFFAVVGLLLLLALTVRQLYRSRTSDPEVNDG